MEKIVLYVFLLFFIMLTGLVMISATQNLDVSGWNFDGSDMAKKLIHYVGHIFLAVSVGVIFVDITRERL